MCLRVKEKYLVIVEIEFFNIFQIQDRIPSHGTGKDKEGLFQSQKEHPDPAAQVRYVKIS